MYYSLLEIFSIGVGPSSSHTVGPMRAAKRYIDNLRARGQFERIARLEATLYGSLALTGEGHGTIKAIVYGFMGLEAEAIDPEKPYVDSETEEIVRMLYKCDERSMHVIRATIKAVIESQEL